MARFVTLTFRAVPKANADLTKINEPVLALTVQEWIGLDANDRVVSILGLQKYRQNGEYVMRTSWQIGQPSLRALEPGTCVETTWHLPGDVTLPAIVDDAVGPLDVKGFPAAGYQHRADGSWTRSEGISERVIWPGNSLRERRVEMRDAKTQSLQSAVDMISVGNERPPTPPPSPPCRTSSPGQLTIPLNG